MSRSYNSRRGCYSYKSWDKECLGLEQRGKQNNKRNRIKFDGVVFTHKRKKAIYKNGYWDKEYVYNWEEKEYMFKEWVFKHWEKHSGKGWHYETYVKPAKESYRNWTWLKGKANIKGWSRSRFRTLIGDLLLPTYYPCQ